jgi:hypothetical protein
MARVPRLGRLVRKTLATAPGRAGRPSADRAERLLGWVDEALAALRADIARLSALRTALRAHPPRRRAIRPSDGQLYDLMRQRRR